MYNENTIEEIKYLDLMREIVAWGDTNNTDRTGIKTRSMFAQSLEFDLYDDRFPLFTTKKMFFRGVVEELLFFIRGETDTKILEKKGVNIWKGNTSREFLDSHGLTHLKTGNMGQGYGYQWRHAGNDQLKSVIEEIKNNPTSRRLIVDSWNIRSLDRMALPPCHCLFQFYVKESGVLDCQMYQRSADMFLGVPFNVASYAMLVKLIAKITNLKPGTLKIVFGDCHVYETHKNAVIEQVLRIPNDAPKLIIPDRIKTLADIENMSFEDFELQNYNPHPAIKAPMAV